MLNQKEFNIEDRLLQVRERFEELNNILADPSVYDDPVKYARLSKEHNMLSDLVKDIDRWYKLKQNIEGNRELIESEGELAELARVELDDLEIELEQLTQDIQYKLVPDSPEDSKNAIIEIRAGTGGDEAAIFVGDLYDMYRRFADSQGWKMEILSVHESEKGGFKEIVFSLSGKDVFAKMKFESGVHRVQRVPQTESQGRIHTSAATVAVLPEAEEVDIKINPSDLEFEAYRATGAGGQHINKTDSAVRIRHLPSGLVVTCQEERSQHKNRDKAMKMLRSKLYEMELEKRQSERAAERKSQVSTGDRSAKIRTYNFPQGRLTDHRIGLTLYNLEDIMKGDIGDVIKMLRIRENLNKLNEN